MHKYRALVRQDGMEVARVSGDDPEAVNRELNHYAALYWLDGPVEIIRNSAMRRWIKSLAAAVIDA